MEGAGLMIVFVGWSLMFRPLYNVQWKELYYGMMRMGGTSKTLDGARCVTTTYSISCRAQPGRGSINALRLFWVPIFRV